MKFENLFHPKKLIEIEKMKKMIKDNRIPIYKFRICNSNIENDFVDGYRKEDTRELVFLSLNVVKTNSILVDSLGNLYSIIESRLGIDKTIEENECETIISKYGPFVPPNKFRNMMQQIANINQEIKDLKFENVSSVVLNIEQKAEINQIMSVEELIDSAADEAKYLFKPISKFKEFVNIVSDIARSVRTLTDEENKLVNNILKQSSGLIKDIIEMLINKLKEKIKND